MPERFGAATLVEAPRYPNAAAADHIVTILRPPSAFGPRGLITLPPHKPFSIGVVDRQASDSKLRRGRDRAEYLLSPCLLPTCLYREVKPSVRSISWSPVGFAPNAGCLLAVCTTDGRVKIYRMPYCEFLSEWVEVMDISEMLNSYLVSVNYFEESELLSPGNADNPASKAPLDQSNAEILPTILLEKEKSPKRLKASITFEIEAPPKLNKDKRHGSSAKKGKQTPGNCNLPLITPEKFASRSALLSSVTVAWSPILLGTTEVEESFPNNPPSNCALLAVAGKSGRVSFWRFDQPQCYTNMNSMQPISVSLIGLPKAHNSWITAVSWALFVPDAAADPVLVLATGSSDGSVKTWKAYSSEVTKASEANSIQFYLLKEIVMIDYGMVSVLSICLPLESSGKVLLAIGGASGSLEVRFGDLNSHKFEREGHFNAHDHILTGLAWAFGGNCLYSCSQDGSIRSWVLHGSVLSETPLPSNIPGSRGPSDIPDDYDLCLGLALSPGNLAIAVAHSMDTDMLNPMYEARTQKAAVEYLWIGGQQLDLSSSEDQDIEDEPTAEFSKREQINWEHNMLWSLRQLEHNNKPLVIWDRVAALLAFNKSLPNFLANIVLYWLRSLFGSKFKVSPATSFEIPKLLSNISSRQLQVVNVIGRRIYIERPDADRTVSKHKRLRGLDDSEEEHIFWLKLVSGCERELRERLFALKFSAILRCDSSVSTNFVNGGSRTLVGLDQMMRWVSLNIDDLKEHGKSLTEEVAKIKKSLVPQSEERCSFCSSAVLFESAEEAYCQGLKCAGGNGERHRLARCAVSMLVCPITPTWFCICCHRYAFHLAPPLFFMLPKYPLDLSVVPKVTCISEQSAKPLCPFCGILLHRRQPEFLLSPSPV